MGRKEGRKKENMKNKFKIYFSNNGRLLTSFLIERAKFCPAPELEPESPAFRVDALISELSRTSTVPCQKFPLL